MDYFSIDCEASGPLPPLYNLLSIGATVLRADQGSFQLGESFYVELKPIFPGVDPKAIKVCGLDMKKLEAEGEDPREAMSRFSSWVKQQNRGSTSPIFVGHNAVFDWAYISYYFAHFDFENPFGYKGIDTKSLAMGRLGISWFETSKERLKTLLDLPPEDPAQVHRADYDAWYQALILKRLLEIPPGKLPSA